MAIPTRPPLFRQRTARIFSLRDDFLQGKVSGFAWFLLPAVTHNVYCPLVQTDCSVKLDQLITLDRVGFVAPTEALNKEESLWRLATLLARGLNVPAGRIAAILAEREAVQSTGIGDGVAIPHGTLEGAPGQIGAVLLCPGGVAFDSIDDLPARLLFGVVGPRQAVEHLKILARVSRLLRSATFRDRLLAEQDPSSAFNLLHNEDVLVG